MRPRLSTRRRAAEKKSRRMGLWPLDDQKKSGGSRWIDKMKAVSLAMARVSSTVSRCLSTAPEPKKEKEKVRINPYLLGLLSGSGGPATAP